MRKIAVTIIRDGEFLEKFEVRAAEWSSQQLIGAIEQLFTSPGWLNYQPIERGAEDDDYSLALSEY